MVTFLLAIIFVILNILDITTTRKVLRDGGYEANPIARLLMRFHLFIPAKIIMIIIVLSMMIVFDENAGTTLGFIVCGIYGFIVWNNFRTIRLQREDLRVDIYSV